MKRKGTRGKPAIGTQRLITKAEFALLRHLGAKRTHYIASSMRGEIVIFYKLNQDQYRLALCSTPEAIQILKEYWGIA